MGKALFGILEILLITTLEMGSVVFLGKSMDIRKYFL